MFNDTKPKMFSVLQTLDNIAEQLLHSANKFRTADPDSMEGIWLEMKM